MSTDDLWLPDTARTSRRTFLGGSLGVAAATFGLSACAGAATGKKAYSDGPASTGTISRGGTLRIGAITNGSVETISPLATIGISDFVRLFSLYDPLFFPGPNGTTIPALAESATPSADAKTWTFQLRRGVVWHDGKPFTADDVVYTVQHSWGDKTNIFNAVLATIVDFGKARKVDDHTVQIVLKVAIADFTTVTCFPNCYIVQDGTKNFGNGNGTGPFTLKTFKPGSYSLFSANKNYWRHNGPYVDSLVVDSSYISDQSRLNALLANAIDVAPGVPPALAQANARTGRIVLGNQPGPGFVGPVMRVDQGALKNPVIRQALKLIPDRDQFVSNVYQGYATLANDAPGFTNKYWADDLKQVQDIDQAKALLKSAGASDLRLALKTSTVVPGQSDTATLLQQQAKQAGVTIDVQRYTPAEFYTPQAGFFTRDFSVTFFSTGVNSLAVFYLSSMVPAGPYNESHFGGDAAASKLIFDAIGEVDEAKAGDKWHAVQEQQVKDGPYIIPATNNWLDAYGKKVRGAETTSAFSCNYYDFSGTWLS